MASRSSSRNFALAIDIGGTKVAISMITDAGEPLIDMERRLIPFDDNHRADPMRLLEILAPFVEQARRMPGTLHGIGLSCCGAVDHKTGVAALVANLGWRQMPIGDIVERAFGLRVCTAADVRMATLAEAVWGAARGVRNFAWATVGTGYGGHLFLDGKLYDGTHGFAGNYGHTTYDEVNGDLCGCGRKGCVETFVAGPGIARAGQRAADRGESPYLQEIARQRSVITRDVFDAELAGDTAAQAIVESAIRIIGINLGGLVNTLDLELIMMGGGVVHGCSTFVERVSHRIGDFIMTDETRRDLRIVKESFENSALVGAAAEVFVRQGLLQVTS